MVPALKRRAIVIASLQDAAVPLAPRDPGVETPGCCHCVPSDAAAPLAPGDPIIASLRDAEAHPPPSGVQDLRPEGTE